VLYASGILLRPIPGTGLLAIADARGVECPPDDLVADPGQITDPAAADQYRAVLLEVVALAGDIGGHLDA
jgi:hypothetical protein